MGRAIVIAGGGTGGHTSPGLALAAALAARDVPCEWIGTAAGLEARLVPEAGIPFHAIRAGKLRRYWDWKNVSDLAFNVPAGWLRARRLLARIDPGAVFATGGFVALPVALAAASRGIPVVVHEQTAVPGLANRVAARVARRVAVSFAATAAAFPAGRVVVTGNPLRPGLRGGDAARAQARYDLDPALPLVYVTGGAQGASRINRAVGEALPRLLERAQIVHQCGDNPVTGDARWLADRRAALPPALARRYTVVPYVGAELADLYAAVTLVVSRAGAGTVNECCQLGLPALYIPLPGAGADEQTANARLVEQAGGAAILPQAALTADTLSAGVLELLGAPARLAAMRVAARTLAVPDAAERLADLVLAVRDGRL